MSDVIADNAVARVFAAYPPKLRKRLLAVRRMILAIYLHCQTTLVDSFRGA